MLSVKVFFLIVALAVAVVANALETDPDDPDGLLTCTAHGNVLTDKKSCILKCTVGCTSVGCGLFKKCETVVEDENTTRYKCHCNFGL